MGSLGHRRRGPILELMCHTGPPHLQPLDDEVRQLVSLTDSPTDIEVVSRSKLHTILSGCNRTKQPRLDP
jgi:hypothetical protein